MSWEVITAALGGIAALAALVWVGFTSGRKATERAAKAEAERESTQEDMDAIVRFHRGERAARDYARNRLAQLKRLRDRARRELGHSRPSDDA